MSHHVSEDGLLVEDYVASLIEEGIMRRDRIEQLAEKSFDEILARSGAMWKRAG